MTQSPTNTTPSACRTQLLRNYNMQLPEKEPTFAKSYSPTSSGASNSDMVNHPPHYNKGKFETIEVLEDIARFYPPKKAYNAGQVVKYLARAPHKGNLIEDLKKAQWYLNRLVTQAETEVP